CFPVFTAISLTVSLFVATSTTGQSARQSETLTTDAPLSSSVQETSARIAKMYNADLETVQAFVQAAVDLESRTGIAAPVVIAIALHESGFNSYLFINTGNPFGIKASKPWDGPTFSMWHDDEETKFRVYYSAVEALLDFGNFVHSRTWYADALACSMDDYPCVIDGLKKTDTEAGYSMNPNWDEGVLAVIEKVGLQELAVR
ncbi:MAG TPA: glucosaminidase domain-containing protein, partial [Saprospiraceae bacterium]|nr:glucosaminidase domain-containing protein [Saprospiraceae bacterium]